MRRRAVQQIEDISKSVGGLLALSREPAFATAIYCAMEACEDNSQGQQQMMAFGRVISLVCVSPKQKLQLLTVSQNSALERDIYERI